MIKLSNGRRQKYVSTLILFSMCRTDERHSRSNRKMDGSSGRTQVVFVIPRCSGYRWKKQLNSSVKFSQDFQRSLFSKRTSKTWREGTSCPRSSKTGSSSCQCSMTLSGRRMLRTSFRMPKKVKNYAMIFSQGYWTFLSPATEEKWYGDSHDQKGQWSHAANKMVQRFKETGHFIFKCKYQCPESWNREAEKR